MINNQIDGTGISNPSEGFEVWNVNPNAPVLIQGGSASNVDIGIFVNNYEGYNSDAGNTDCVIDQVDLTVNLEKGIYVKDSPSNTNGATVNALIQGNTEVTTNTTTGQGILVEGADASADIQDNLATITGNAIGILVDAGDATITKNTITANEVGVRFQSAGTGEVNNNNILDNITSGVDNLTGADIDATLNWWGHVSGPSGEGSGTGDAVSIDVTFCPWLGAIYEGIPVAESGPVANTTTSAIYCTVQDAIDAATSGDVIEVIVADHTEPGQIVVDKSLTIQGQGKATTTLRPGVNTGSSGDARAFILVNPGIELHLSDLTIDGFGKLVHQAIRHQGFGTVDQVAFNEIKYNESGPTYAGTAIVAFGNGNVDVTNSMFTEIGRVGVLYFGNGITGSLFQNNMYTGKGTGNWLDYALDISAGANVQVDANTISNNKGVAMSDGSTSAGILVSTFFALGTAAEITGNDISENTTGIYVGFDAADASTVIANHNNIFDNDNGVISTNAPVDATANWWGDASGPSGEGPGTGDSASPNVDFCGWLIEAFDGSPNPATAGIPDADPTTTIQACSGEAYSFDLDIYLNNLTMAEVGQVTYTYDVTVVPNVNVLFPDPRASNVVSNDGEVSNTITNFGSQPLTVRYTVTPTSEYGCVGAAFVVNVVINLNPQVDIIPSGTTDDLCPAATRMVSGAVVPGATYTYLWEILQDPSGTSSSTILPANNQTATLTVGSDAANGTLIIKFTATNSATGCQGSEIFDFMVNDTEDPVAICQNINVQLDGTGNASISVANINNGSTDNCSIASMALDITDFTCADEGENMVMLTVTDASGNSHSCQATVTVIASQACGFPPCVPVIDIDAAYLANDPHLDDFRASMTIIADGLITSPEIISFKAENEVELRPVFEVEQGAILTIDIEPCVVPSVNSENKN
ncbi:MAG: hypothetical protein IPL46_21215 [Saprospiraceae bacterium]|nr:hypothetical protein [Saprospiraceae bacterium]